MKRHASHQKEIADDFLSRFPKAPTLTLARMAYNAHPSIWRNLDTARNYFRFRRGAIGSLNRRNSTDKSHFRAPQKPGDPFGRMPAQLRDFDEWGSVNFSGPCRVLVISDLHIPYYDRKATICALKYGQELGANVVLLNGDIADFFALSFWENDPRKRNFPKEIRDLKDFLRSVRDLFPRARIIYKLGNHEERMIRYMRVKAPELLGLPEFEIESVLGLADNDIQLVKDNRPIKFGGLNIIHGHEYRFAISNPVNPARGLFLRGKTNAICGHFHQSSQHSERSLDQKVLSTWSTGCLCDLHPEYRPINNWNHGFMVVQVDKNDAFEVGNLRIVSGKAYY
jgi:predicted phosphodiesterase